MLNMKDQRTCMVHFEDQGMFPKVHWRILEDSGRFLARIPYVFMWLFLEFLPMIGLSPTLPTILAVIPPVDVAHATLPCLSMATAPTVSWPCEYLWYGDKTITF